MRKSDKKSNDTASGEKKKKSEKTKPGINSSPGEDADVKKAMDVLKTLKESEAGVVWNEIKGPAHKLFGQLLSDSKKARGKGGKRRGIRVFDSQLLPLPEGVRPATAETRRVKYRFGEGELELSFYPVSPESYEVIGQITGIEAIPDVELVLKRARRQYRCRANQFMLFRFERVVAGNYGLTAATGDKIILEVDVDI